MEPLVGFHLWGVNPTIAVLFPTKHAAWARELLFWA